MRDQKRCRFCRYWQRSSDPNCTDEGECRRANPVPAHVMMGAVEVVDAKIKATAMWPTTFVDDWCGEWLS